MNPVARVERKGWAPALYLRATPPVLKIVIEMRRMHGFGRPNSHGARGYRGCPTTPEARARGSSLGLINLSSDGGRRAQGPTCSPRCPTKTDYAR